MSHPSHRVAIGVAAALLSTLAACADPSTAPARSSLAPTLAVAPTPGAIAADTVGSQITTFAWLTPTTLTQPASFADAFDGGALPTLAVEVCALDAAESACAAAPIARYTATTSPYAQQIRPDSVRQFHLVYWNTAVSSGAPVVVGKYRVRVLSGARPLGHLDVQVVATSGAAASVDRSKYGVVVRGQQMTLRFRVGRSTMADETMSADAVAAVATEVYAALDGGATPAEMASGVRDIVAALMPMMDAAQQSEIDARIAQGLPFAFDFQADLVARSLGDRSLTSIASFVDAAREGGATMQGDGAPLTVAALTSVVGAAAAQPRYGPEEIVPGLVAALGRARAMRAGTTTDAVWGDGQLDALQTMLLVYSIHYAGLDAAPLPFAVSSRAPLALRASAAPSGGWFATKLKQFGPNAARNFVAGRIGKKIEMPLTWVQAATASSCASVLMNSYRFAIAGTPTQLGRIGLGLPTASAITADLTFDFVPNAFGAIALSKIGCALPPNGAAPGKAVQWTVGDGLQPHGSLAQQSATTDAGGRATATYQTIDEVVPQALRSLAKDATGTVDVRATGLVPGWSRLEKSVGVGVLNPTDAGVRLQVRHYDWPSALRLDYSIGLDAPILQASLRHYTTVAGSMTMPRSDHDGIIEYFAEGPFAYTDYHMSGSLSSGCIAIPTFTVSGKIGFAAVASDAASPSAPFSATPYPTNPAGVEHFNMDCGKAGIYPNSVGGFALMLTQTYTPIAPGNAHARSQRPLTAWQTVQPGVIRQSVSRSIPGPMGAVTETSTYTLTLVP